MKTQLVALFLIALVSIDYVSLVSASAQLPKHNNRRQSTLPGFTGILTQNGLNYATQIGLQILQSKLSSVTVPDQSGDSDTISWTISSIVLTGLTIPSGAITIDSGVGVTVSISDVSGTINANWHGREDIWPHPSGSGSATINLSSVTISAVIQVSDNGGRLSLAAQSVTTSIGNLDMHFSGSGLDFILNLLKSLFAGKIKDAAQNAVSNAVSNEIDTTLNSELATLPIEIPIGNVAELDFSLVSPVGFPSNSYLEIPLKGEFYDINNKVEAPFTPAAMPNTPQTSDMLQGYLNEYVADTASYAFWLAGKMALTIQASQIPSDSPIQFNTSYWTGIVPQLYQLYPNWAMMATMNPTSAPVASFATSGLQASGVGAIDMYVVAPNGTSIPVFTIGINATADGIAQVTGGNITANLTYLNSGCWLISSNIGTFDPTNLLAIVKFLVMVVVVPYFNSFLAVGLPIPVVDKFELVSPKLTYGNGYIFLTTNLQYVG